MTRTLKTIFAMQVIIIAFVLISGNKAYAVQDSELDCLDICIMQDGQQHNVGWCWQDQVGPDEREGPTRECVGGTGDCNAQTCDTEIDGCWLQGDNGFC